MSRLKFCLGIAFPLFIFFILGLGSCTKKKESPTPPPPVRVKVLEVGKEDSRGSSKYSATVASETSTTVSFSVAGTITDLYAREGEKVAKGKILGKVRSGDYENAYSIAQAQLAEAQDGYNRLKKLHDANALPEVKWVEIQQKLKEAQNMAEMAKRTLDNAVIHAPMAGTVTRKYADIGQNIVPAEPIYEITSVADLSAEFSVDENEIGNFDIGQPAIVSFQNPDIPPLKGKIYQKSSVADPLTRGFTVKVDLTDVPDKVLPGMLATVNFVNSDSSSKSVGSSITLPLGCVLLSEDNRWFVWVVNDSLAQRQFVEVNELVDNGIEVISGLKPGDLVITEGMQKVGSRSKVIPIPN